VTGKKSHCKSLRLTLEVDPPVGAEAAGPADGRGIDGADAVAVGHRRGGVALATAGGPSSGAMLGRSKPV